MFILQKMLRFVQAHFDVGEPSKNYFLLRCLDIVAPFMLLKRPRSRLEVFYKTIWICIMFCYIVGLVYDFLRQDDIRGAVDIFCMLSLYVCVYLRPLCLRNYREDIAALGRLDANPRFRVGTPYGDAIRQQVVHKNNVILGTAIVLHFITVTVYLWSNLTTPDSFITLITYWPTDLASVSPTLDKLAQAAYCAAGYVWGWGHASGELTIIILLRMGIAEFRVFLHSLATLDEQIERGAQANPTASRERIVLDLLHEHAQRHRELIVVMVRLRAILRLYTLIHYSLYMAIAAALMTRMIVLPGSSSLGSVIPLLVTSIFFLATLALSLLVEQLIRLNRKVSITLYGFDWPRCLPFGHSIKRTIMLMMMQANNTNDFSAGGLTSVSAELFAKSCRLIYSLMMCMANLANAGT